MANSISLRRLRRYVVRSLRAHGWDPTDRRLGFLSSGLLGFGANLPSDLSRLLLPGGIVVDVGANEGQFAELVLRIQAAVNVHCVEPNPAALRRLRMRYSHDERIWIHGFAMTSVIGPATLYVAESSVGSSLLKPLPGRSEKWLATASKVDVETRTLDEFAASTLADAPVSLLKTDVQGGDLDVLRSGSRLLSSGRVGAVLVELNFEGFYADQPHAPELIAHLEEFGYRLAGLYPPRRRSQVAPIRWADGLFLRPLPSPRPVMF